MPGKTTRNIQYPVAGDPYPSAAWWKNLAQTADDAISSAVSSFTTALNGKAERQHQHAPTDISGSARMLTYPSGWAAYNPTVYAPLQVMQLSYYCGAIYGVIKATAALPAATDRVATAIVPTGWRPNIATLKHEAGSQGGRIFLQINPAGDLRIYAVTAVQSGEYFGISMNYSM